MAEHGSLLVVATDYCQSRQTGRSRTNQELQRYEQPGRMQDVRHYFDSFRLPTALRSYLLAEDQMYLAKYKKLIGNETIRTKTYCSNKLSNFG